MRVHIGADHAAFELKNELVTHLESTGHDVVDHGPEYYDPQDDYPVAVLRAAEAVSGDVGALGVVLGGSGNGEQMAANKVHGIRAALAYTAELAGLARQHNNAQVVSIGARFTSSDDAKAIVDMFVTTPFSEDPRHQRRLEMVERYEASGELPPRLIAVVYAVTAGCLVYAVARSWQERSSLVATLVVLVLVAWLMVWQALSRARLGVQGTLGESMLVDLRDRLRSHGQLPVLPPPWHAEASLHSAYGQSFSGDFIVADRSGDGLRLELALVDVSGKGMGAGTRALQLSGALGGLLGATTAEQFLPAANDYLLRQQWDEGFATAVHVEIELATGDYLLSSAGHPPGVQYSAGSGRWDLLDAPGGPALGILDRLDGASFPCRAGRLERGDALLLYTDGVVESRGQDLSLGIDRMLGAAERLVPGGFAGGAARLSSASRAGESDDRAVVLLWRG